MKKISLIISAFTILIFASCDDYVDIVPRGSAIAENLEDVDALLDHGMMLSGDPGNNNTVALYVNDNIVMLQAAQDYYGLIPLFKHKVNIYNLESTFYLPHETDQGWINPYTSIGRCNYIIEITPGMAGDDLVKNQYVGEAKVHRAHAYWRLVNLFGQHYGSANANESGSGVPILTQFGDIETSLARASVNAVYEFIESELIEAIDLLREGRPFIDRVNKAAAQAMLARVYLHMGKYAEALELTNDVLAFNSNLMDYNDLTGMVPRGAENLENILYKEVLPPTYYTFLGPTAELGYSESLVNAFDQPDFDLRISKLASINGDGIYVINDVSSGFPIGVTVPEIMLIKAECLAQDEGKKDEAMDVLNILREKRFFTDAVEAGEHLLTATDKQDALNKIFDERRREFNILGMRFFDIKRLKQQYNDVNISLVRDDVTWGPNSINWAVPIGEGIIETGGGQIKQNPRE